VPQRATLVLVGDFDPLAVEREIALHFADWRRPATTERAGDSPAQSQAVVETPFSSSSTGVLRPQPASPRSSRSAAQDNSPRRDSSFLEQLGTEMLTARLARAASSPDARYAAASASLYDHFSTARVASIDVEARERDWAGGLQAVGLELRRAIAQGFSPAELTEQLAKTRRTLTQKSRPMTSSALADAIVDAVGRGLVFTKPGDPAATTAYIARVRLEDVNAAFRTAWGKQDRLILVSHHRPVPRAEAAIRAAWASGFGAPATRQSEPQGGGGGATGRVRSNSTRKNRPGRRSS
jgi:zinc protease